jgi:serine/threonine-protein kinase RsbW
MAVRSWIGKEFPMIVPTGCLLPTEPTTWGTGGPWQQASVRRDHEIAPLIDQVAAAMAAHDYPQRCCWEMRLVLQEALSNALRHGNGGDPARRILVCYHVGAADVVAGVEDEGAGFDPAAVPEPTAPENLDKPSGRGLLLMRRYTTWLRYHGRGNRLTLCKHRPPAQPPVPISQHAIDRHRPIAG